MCTCGLQEADNLTAIPLGLIDMFKSTQFAKEMAYLEHGINPLVSQRQDRKF